MKTAFLNRILASAKGIEKEVIVSTFAQDISTGTDPCVDVSRAGSNRYKENNLWR